MTFEWTQDLSTEIDEIDLQHKALIGKFNDLIAVCSQKKGGDEIRKFLQFLTGYAIVHFSDEERLMQERRYPGFDAHHREHQEFRERLARLLAEYSAGMADEVAGEAVWLSAEWFIGHIKRADLAMAAYMRTNGKV